MTRAPLRSYRTCRWCGCREDRACMVPDGDGGFGPCHWVGPRTCSNPNCIAQAKEAMRRGDKDAAGAITPIRKQMATRRMTKDGREICASYYWWLKRRKQAWERDGGQCTGCHVAVELRDAEVDHIRLRGMGGGFRDDSLANLRILCRRCHSARHSSQGLPPLEAAV